MKILNSKAHFPTLICEYDLSDAISKEEVQNSLVNISTSVNTLVDGERVDGQPHTLPQYSNIFNEINKCIRHYCDTAQLRYPAVYDSWVNILSDKGSVGAHRHYGSVISGAFYMDVEEGSSSIYFINPNEGFKMIEVEYVTSYENEFNPNIYSFSPKPLQLVLFPGWILHYVGINNTSRRVTLSFNTK